MLEDFSTRLAFPFVWFDKVPLRANISHAVVDGFTSPVRLIKGRCGQQTLCARLQDLRPGLASPFH